MCSNDIKCKYMFMFPLKNLACKELTVLKQCPPPYLHGLTEIKPWINDCMPSGNSGNLWQTAWGVLCLHETQYILIHAPYTRIVVFHHQICYNDNNDDVFITAIFVKYCSTTVSFYNVWANLCCSGCSPIGENSLWNGTIAVKLNYH